MHSTCNRHKIAVEYSLIACLKDKVTPRKLSKTMVAIRKLCQSHYPFNDFNQNILLLYLQIIPHRRGYLRIGMTGTHMETNEYMLHRLEIVQEIDGHEHLRYH